MLCQHGEIEGEIRTCKSYETKKCIHGSKKKFREHYSANIDLEIRDLDMEYGITCCGNKLSERRNRRDRIEV